MDETKNIIKDQLLKLPKDVRVFVVKSEWINKIKNISSKFNLEENSEVVLEYLVLNVMIGLSDPKNIAEDIIRKTGIDRNIAEWITESIEKDILEPYSELFPEENTTEIKGVERFAPNSYEQILINQAKAMRPVGISTEQQASSSQVPHNLPTEENSNQGAIHNSIGYSGSDPYREPAE